MKKNIHLWLLLGLGFTISLSSCFKDLDTVPLDPDISTAAVVYDDPDTYRQVLAKAYAGLAVSGQEGPAGNSDIEGIDEGFGQYLRGLWYHQEFTTEEALVGWNDQTIADFHNHEWTARDGFIFAFYSRIFYQIPLCNEFIRESTPEKLEERNQTELEAEVSLFRSEARFLRALSYWHALDMFRNVPFITEEDLVGSFFPEQTSAQELFDYIESELLAIEDEIVPVRQNEYGRADQGAVWALLAKLYLNAEVYVGQARWDDCLAYCERLISSGYTLDEDYQRLFLADNHLSEEIIFPIAFDGVRTRTWGGTTFIIRAGIGGNMDPQESGVNSGWGGVRTTPQLVDKFGDIGGIVSAATEGNTVRYPKIYTPGSFQDFDFSDTNNALSSVNSDRIYEGYKYFPEAGEFLITQIPSASAPKFGDNDADGVLDPNGSNINIDQEGLYFIQVDLNDNSYSITKTDFGIVGDATPGGWDVDTPMEWSEENQALVVNVALGPGEFKFRANADWAINYGDTGADGVLDFDGDNISVPPSDYEILFFPNRPDYTYQIKERGFDRRPFFHTDGQTLSIEDITQFTNGYAITKFKNINSDGTPGSNLEHPDTDFPVFRLADFYLMAAEAIVRGGGDLGRATEYFNAVRARGFGGIGGTISSANLDLDIILDERARELYWEGHRRTDLIRFGQFSDGNYHWEWKGGVQEGRATESFRDVFPIPSSDIAANPNLTQNEGY